MGQAIGETIFEAAYLVFAIVSGIRLLIRSHKSTCTPLAGLASLILGCGDAFHLVPRMYALWHGGTANYPGPLGFGTFVTSITMTVFYVLLYQYLKHGTGKTPGRLLDCAVYLLAAVRILLCLFPQNRWTSPEAPLSWGIYRNIPFAALGLLMIVLAYRWLRKGSFRFLWLAILLSFGFYLPVVLFADIHPMIGMLMLPKTVMYVWIIVMLLQNSKGTD